MATDTEAAGGVPSILRPLADDLAARRERARQGGGPDKSPASTRRASSPRASGSTC
jgi:hypothetical protein